jgi:hypothetical protein
VRSHCVTVQAGCAGVRELLPVTASKRAGFVLQDGVHRIVADVLHGYKGLYHSEATATAAAHDDTSTGFEIQQGTNA